MAHIEVHVRSILRTCTTAVDNGGSRKTQMPLNKFSSFSQPSASSYTRASAAIPAKSTMQYLNHCLVGCITLSISVT